MFRKKFYENVFPKRYLSLTLSNVHLKHGFSFIFLSEHDFRWVFFTRFLMQQGVATVVGFLEYWLGDMVALPGCWAPEKAVAVILLPLLLSAAVL